MSTMIQAVPLTPRKPNDQDANLKIKRVVEKLCRDWDLQFQVPTLEDSPSTRLNKTLPQECVFKIKYLTFKNAINGVLADFDHQANIQYRQWVNKPKGDRGTIPEVTRHRPHPVSDDQRLELQKLFRNIADQAYREAITQEPRTPFSERRTLRSGTVKTNDTVNVLPIPIKLPTSARKLPLKRAAEDVDQGAHTFKRPPKPDSRSEQNPPSHSANTSFETNVSSVFDQSSLSYGVPLTRSSTIATIPDDDDPCSVAPPLGVLDSAEPNGSSDYELSSSFNAALTEAADSFGGPGVAPLESETVGTKAGREIPRDVGASLEIGEAEGDSKEEKLRKCLVDIFPSMPVLLLEAPLYVRYEIMRVFLHTDTPLSSFVLPAIPNWDSYESLWEFLKNFPALKGKAFPERVSKMVWAACQSEFMHGSRGVSMSGSLRYGNPATAGPLFRFQLKPLKLEQTNRLRRRFGNDRFLELDIPSLTSRRVPRVLKNCPDGKSIVIEWLFQDVHRIFGRHWVPFFSKPQEVRERKAEAAELGEVDAGVSHRLYFFAIGGIEFGDNRGTPKESETVNTRTEMSVESLLNWIRPTLANKHQGYLKLYDRTRLALSRNAPSIVLAQSQIRYKKDMRHNGDIMTDGAGRLSSALATNIMKILALSHLPSGFQGRIGDAKGFWSIDSCYHGNEEWIEIYESQRKWQRSGEGVYDPDSADPAHRTFEVNKWSSKLKSADLNTQLMPILMDRARSRHDMGIAIEKLLIDDLEERFGSQRVAMENPLLFRKWLRESNSGLADRVKHGVVPYVAALPDAIEEKLNMFLDAGFHPLKLRFLKELSQKYYFQKCDELKKRLNITVPRSTYAYMVPDFAGVLEPDEIYIHFSESFVDELSQYSGCPLTGMDVLVARSPAHFASDVQKVRAVIKPELLGLKDVVIFPTKGNPSLAAKLSGGDYDGDLAWVCWEPSIVRNFDSAEVPRCLDLVKEGFLSKISTTYEELVRGDANPTTNFLKRSFEFNLEQSMLGICTNFKENLCYTQQRLDSKEVVYLSTLLSNLVDQSKQGYVFTEPLWDKFKRTVIKITPQVPLYKNDVVDNKSKHIIDRLMFVAHSRIEKIKKDFHDKVDQPPWWDPELVAPSSWASRQAIKDQEWAAILKKLKEDIAHVERAWKKDLPREGIKRDEPFGPAILRCYELFQAIKPEGDTPLTRSLLTPWNPNPETSDWALLRASQAMAAYSRHYVASFVWWMAGKQLCYLKANQREGTVSIAPHMYAMLRPDSTFVKMRVNEESMYQWEDEAMKDVADVEDP